MSNYLSNLSKAPTCLQTADPSSVIINIRADDGRTYLFATAHYLDGVHEANSAKDDDSAPERLTLRFTTGEVVVLGSRLTRIEDLLAEGKLRGLNPVAPRHAAAVERGPIILSITINRKTDI